MLLPTLQVIVAHSSFLYATIVPLVCGGTGLSVYRSSALPESDDWYKPVRKYLDKHQPEFLWTKTVKDDSMMFGEAQHTVWKVKEKV